MINPNQNQFPISKNDVFTFLSLLNSIKNALESIACSLRNIELKK